MSLLSMLPHPSEFLRERLMLSALSDSMFEDCGSTRKKEKFGKVFWR